MKKLILSLFVLISAYSINSHAESENSSCYDELTSIAVTQGLTGSYTAGVGIFSLTSGGTVASMFGGPIASVGGSSLYQSHQSLAMTSLYNEALLGQGPLLNQLALEVFQTTDIPNAQMNRLIDSYLELVDSSFVCEKIMNDGSYYLSNIAQDLRDIL